MVRGEAACCTNGDGAEWVTAIPMAKEMVELHVVWKSQCTEVCYRPLCQPQRHRTLLEAPIMC